MEEEHLISIENISKIFSKNYTSARVQLKQLLLENFIGCRDHVNIHKDEFYALKNISLVINRNERVAILGPNGSGKSTLLKMLTGIYLPDSGTIKVKGNISSILELSTGFKPELTGLENIYLKFSMLGRKKEEVDKVLDKIIAFSELKDFMDTPIKHYSSGMKSKLGFAIVTTMTPEILILDEVFAAGDRKFKLKSKTRIKELYQNTTTILVTHSMSIVRDIADRVIILNKGEKVFDGNVTEGISYYEELQK